ncbi:hypothetical protein RvY_06947-3 [Ramazzottius varieornatus]|uniref:Uncharacterized protein n=1 Tax=Ramazzottius varieornatus TaxID=947166 RepID=A0A1D1V0B9_RAMVA|nr:hypothetical protein RvY_06947-3 [Ramazzottius varieornatus]
MPQENMFAPIAWSPKKKVLIRLSRVTAMECTTTDSLQEEIASVRLEAERKDEELAKLKRELEASRINKERELSLLKEQHKADYDRLQTELNLKNQELAKVSNLVSLFGAPSGLPYGERQNQFVRLPVGRPAFPSGAPHEPPVPPAGYFRPLPR